MQRHDNKSISEGLQYDWSKIFWAIWKSKKINNFGASSLKFNHGELISESEGKTSVLTNQSCSVFTKQDSTLPHLNSKYPTIDDLRIDINGALKLLQNIDVNKAVGPYYIPNIILKTCAAEFAPGRSAIFDFSINRVATQYSEHFFRI